jgi:hypothetical protein
MMGLLRLHGILRLLSVSRCNGCPAFPIPLVRDHMATRVEPLDIGGNCGAQYPMWLIDSLILFLAAH